MTGSTLSHYRIVSELGRGGMGIVYLAEDTKLDRQVAIKVLPPNALASEDDRARFYREAKAAAALNHPNIAQIYQIDEAVPSDAPHGTHPSPFIAMEYIDGEPLDERIRRGPLKISEAVRLTTQIAGALGEAHEKGIVHRDVKASNVMLTSKGDAKVLDFGLALTAASTKLTRMGSTLGTVAYMSPEQARGEEVDRRTDLWALGVVLYEMVAGRNPFGGDYEQAVVYSILNADPEPLTAVRTGVPMELERIVGKALSKDRDIRYQSAADLIADLKGIDVRGESGTSQHRAVYSTWQANGLSGGSSARPRSPSLTRNVFSAVVIAAALLLGIALGGMLRKSQPEAERETVRAALLTDGEEALSHPAISEQGDYVAYSAAGGRLILMHLATGRKYIPVNLEDPRLPRFSPNGNWLVFEHNPPGLSIMRIPDGVPAELTPVGATPAWQDDEHVIFSDDVSIFRISRITQRVDTLWTPTAGGLTALAHPEPIHGTDLILVSMISDEQAGIGLLDARTGSVQKLRDRALAPRYLKSGHVVFTEQSSELDYEGRVFAQPFNLSGRALRGPAVPVLSFRGFYRYNVNARGDLVTTAGLGSDVTNSAVFEIRRLDPVSKVVSDPLRTLPVNDQWNVSPDGAWFAYAVPESNDLVAGPLDESEGGLLRFTLESSAAGPEFSEDGEQIYFSEGSLAAGYRSHQISLVGGSAPREFIDSDFRYEFASGHRDGAGRLFAHLGNNLDDPWTLALFDPTDGSIETLMESNGFFPTLSPDGRYIAYEQPDNPGIYVVGADGSGPWRIMDDVFFPRWSRDGTSLYYWSTGGLFRIPLTMERGVRASGPPELMYAWIGEAGYEVAGETGDVFIVEPISGLSRGTDRIDMILNWSAQLREVAPSQ